MSENVTLMIERYTLVIYHRRLGCGASINALRGKRLCNNVASSVRDHGLSVFLVNSCFQNKGKWRLSTFSGVVVRLWLTACVLFVCFFCTPSPLPHAPLSPTWNDSHRGIKVVLLCATDSTQGEAAEAVDNRSLEEILSSIPPPPPPAMTNEPGAPRLMITHLVNRNFKSYADEQILGPFHKVRPNVDITVNCVWRVLYNCATLSVMVCLSLNFLLLLFFFFIFL